MALKGISITTILGVGLGIYFLSALLPGAFENFFAVNTTTWDTGTAALWLIIPLVVIALVVYHFVPKSGGKGE